MLYCLRFAGVMFNKDVVAPGRMRRKIVNPRILLLDCPLEYKKGENQTNVEITKVGGQAVHPGHPRVGFRCKGGSCSWIGRGLEPRHEEDGVFCELTLCTSRRGDSNDTIRA